MENRYSTIIQKYRGLAKLIVVIFFIMVWVLIDKGNVWAQQSIHSSADRTVGTSVRAASPLLRTGDGDELTDDSEGSGQDNSFTVFPNPVKGELVFDFEFTVREGAPFEVIDPQGKLVRSGMVGSGLRQHQIDLSRLPSGMYLIRITLGGKPQLKRVIKQ